MVREERAKTVAPALGWQGRTAIILLQSKRFLIPTTHRG
jgi:hypothetical protein